MKPRHTFNIKSTGFDYTKVRKIEQQTEEKKEAPPIAYYDRNKSNFNVNSNEMVTVSRPRLKKNRFQKD